MAHEGIIVGKNEGKSIPLDYLKMIQAKYKTSGAYAFAAEGKVEFMTANGVLPIEGGEGIEAAMKAWPQRSILYFGKHDSDYLSDDLQPFPLVTKDGKAIVVAFAEGDFSSFDEGANAHSYEHHMVRKWLRGKIEGLYNGVSGDLNKLAQTLDSEGFRNDLQLVIHSRGTITFFLGNGEWVTCAKKNPLAGSWPWGWSSNKLEYVEAEAPKTAVPVAGMSMMDKLKAAAAATAGPAVGTIADATAPKPTDTAAPKDLRHFPVSKDKGSMKQWYGRHHKDGRPKNWEENPGIPEENLRPNSPLKGTLSLKSQPQVVVGDVPVINPDVIPNIQKLFKEASLMKPTDILDVEQPYSNWFEQFGLEESEVARAPYDFFLKIANGNKVIAVLCNTLRKKWVDADPSVFEGTEIQTETQEEADKPLSMMDKLKKLAASGN